MGKTSSLSNGDGDGYLAFVNAFRETPKLKEVSWMRWCMSLTNFEANPQKKCEISKSSFGDLSSTLFLSKVGMSLLVDQSGRLFTHQKCSLKDILCNKEVGGKHPSV